jgi:hypothetical protein
VKKRWTRRARLAADGKAHIFLWDDENVIAAVEVGGVTVILIEGPPTH